MRDSEETIPAYLQNPEAEVLNVADPFSISQVILKGKLFWQKTQRKHLSIVLL